MALMWCSTQGNTPPSLKNQSSWLDDGSEFESQRNICALESVLNLEFPRPRPVL